MFEKSLALMRHILSLINLWVLPFTCILCAQTAKRQQDLCCACLKVLPIITQSCPNCANIMPSSSLCGLCLKNPPSFSRTLALFVYQEPIVSLIIDLKFKRRLVNARILGELMADKLRWDWLSTQTRPDLLMPVPLHRERLKTRGFNQALEIARPIAARLGLELDYHSAQRIKATPAQRQLSADTRRQNIKNAFLIRRNLQGLKIAILDDVMTTGSTAEEFSRALLAQGAKEVEVWCCARVLR